MWPYTGSLLGSNVLSGDLENVKVGGLYISCVISNDFDSSTI